MSRTIEIDIIQHRDTGLLIATSTDLRGLYAHGRSYEELIENACTAIQAILEAKGERIRVVRPVTSGEAHGKFEAVPQHFSAEVLAAA